jgi:hypothetical protein
MNSTERRILENARKLDKLEREFLKFTYETIKPGTPEELMAFFDEAMWKAAEAFNAKNEILEDFKDVIELTIQDKHALRLLDSLRRGEKQYSIAFYENIVEMHNKKVKNRADKIATSLRDRLYDKIDDLISDFHSWFNSIKIIEYYYSQIVIGPIIDTSKVPSHFLSYFNKLKETYAFGQYRASVALCRALLEMALYQKLKARRAFKDEDPKTTNIDVRRENNLSRYITMAQREKILSKKNQDDAHSIRKAANDVLHTKDAEKPLDYKVVLESIFKTLRILEELYR